MPSPEKPSLFSQSHVVEDRVEDHVEDLEDFSLGLAAQPAQDDISNEDTLLDDIAASQGFIPEQSPPSRSAQITPSETKQETPSETQQETPLLKILQDLNQKNLRKDLPADGQKTAAHTTSFSK